MNFDASQFSSHTLIPEPFLSYHPERTEDKHRHPLIGLSEFGPFSQSFSNYIYNPIRIAAIVPSGKKSVIKNLITEMEMVHLPKERKNYLIPFKGFSSTFQMRIAAAKDDLIIEMTSDFEKKLNDSPNPNILLADELNKSISVLQAQRTEFDVLMIYLPDHWKLGFYGKEDEDYDLHDFLKGLTATRSTPLQIITDNALQYKCRASVMWRLSIAIYCKAGGVPWKLADSAPETAYIGLSYAVRNSKDNGPRFVTCCSQVFDEDGAGLEFLAYETNEIHQDFENPYLSRSEMRRVMARSLSLYQKRHGGRVPKKVVIHKSFNFTNVEIEGCFDAWKSSDGLHLIQIQTNSMWRGITFDAPISKNQKAQPSSYPILRGTSIQLDGRNCLLWTQGNAPTAVGGKNFFKEGKGIPKPLLLTRYAGHGSWDEDCKAILGLSKMNWNNDGLYDFLPVTLGYSEVLARTVKRIPDLMPRPYEFRYFM